ncbi:preprotein translocase subunit SecG [Porticoccus sp. W117]|uniref:preprotein translocase subunit SecG n=1 Tax=Porticoccus sp. W117 TaxID=3054777 RepID=UPI0025942FD1|nr:preprotein translocase subunit SecG [Porticoccus sp. W117]MDM3871295.1 preprotein translocase subunit SecG [Porticoccus sp. W117]
MTENLILVIHVLVALAIIGLILLQQGKGAEAGASFGAGASQTIFGSSGSWNFFSKMTAILATVFFVTSLTLAVVAKNNLQIDDQPAPGLVVEDEPAETDIPVMDEAVNTAEDDIPQVNDAAEKADEESGK